MTTERAAGASDLMRGLGLFVDGPARWGNAVSSRRPGVFLVELPGGAESAPIDIVAVRRWVDRVPSLRLDGETPTPQDLAKRLHEFWLAKEPILYVGRSAKSIGSRVAGMYETVLGDSKPYSGGHWLKTLSVLGDLRVWWADADAFEEYEDALLSIVADRNDGLLPFANLTGTDGTPKKHGFVNSLLADPAGAAKSAAAARASAKRSKPTTVAKARRTVVRDAPLRPTTAPTYVSRSGLDKLGAELEELRTTVRPQVIARVKAARELGDLKENADYEYARKEQSFVEGRIQTIEQMIKQSVIIDEAQASDVAQIGSTVVVDSDGMSETYLLVGSAEADPASGKISNVSPVGRALLGARAGDTVTAQLPGGSIVFEVREVR